MKERIKTLIANLKHSPGVYLMHDKNDKIIYIGKAKDLYKRVSQYFLRSQSGKVQKMVFEAEWFETIITSNEKEALILEMNLIQTHYPKFNILLKDDKHYPYIAIRKDGDPYLQIKRTNKEKNYEYFGPFPNSGAAYEMVDLLNKLFPLRKCRTLPSSPCLYYHLGQCLGPCIKKIDRDEYLEIIKGIESFLKGDNKKQYQEIEKKMLEASNNEDYETASYYKKILDSINHINTSQNVEFFDKIDRDIFAYSTRENYVSLAALVYRNGMLLGKEVYVLELFGEMEEFVEDLILQFYQKRPLPKEIVINSNAIKDHLSDLLDASLTVASKGKLFDLVKIAKTNADNALSEYFLSARLNDNKLELLEKIAKILNIDTPLHIELFDNSHLQGSSPVGAMVAFINGEPAKKLYRKFHIEHQESRDDLKSMEEVIRRHYQRQKDNNGKLPDLILVDGGELQIKAADKVIKSLDLDIPTYGLFKNDKHQTSGIMDVDGHIYDLNNDKSIFFFLTRMQDEVHRFAISFHRDVREKAMKSSLLDDIKGLGEKRKETIRKAYPDVSLLKNASIEELSQLLPDDIARALHKKLKE
ncbi:MAG: excinuclease ABC subunit UvrC [Erysipelotrichaceae bacterium]|nr:excinuclease ABC subunit UvrC [Erysipelotrichaceae bacterium]